MIRQDGGRDYTTFVFVTNIAVQTPNQITTFDPHRHHSFIDSVHFTFTFLVFIKETSTYLRSGVRDDGKAIYSTPVQRFPWCNFILGSDQEGTAGVMEGADSPGEASISNDVCVVAHKGT
jgi:hypothetical protein